MLAVSTTAGLLATVTLLLSAVGGWIAGLLADRIGRVRTLQITNLWFSLFTSLQGYFVYPQFASAVKPIGGLFCSSQGSNSLPPSGI